MQSGIYDADRFVDEIMKLKELERLTCSYISTLTESRVYKFCKYLPKLRDLRVRIHAIVTLEDITKWIRAADKLDKLYINVTYEYQPVLKISVDSRTYEEWIEIVEKRLDKKHLFLSLDDGTYKAELTPADRVMPLKYRPAIWNACLVKKKIP